jgi:hypothetical protein
VYAPATDVAPAATKTTTTTATTGHSTGALVTTGLLSFGAGMLVSEIFDDDDDWDNHNNGYYYPNYGHGGMPYYPPYPYRPSYGNGYYPSNGYNRPPNYQHGFNNNNVVVVNKGGNDYWSDRDRRNSGYQKPGAYKAKSPITAAKPNRPELNDLNKRQPKPMPKDAKRPSPTTTKDNWRSQNTYAGNKAGQNKASAARPAAVGASAGGASGRDVPKKVQGSYAGATPDRAQSYNRPSAPTAKPATRDMQRPQPGARPAAGSRDVPAKKPQGDRGYGAQGQRPQQMNKPTPSAKPQQMNKPKPSAGGGGGNRGSAVSGANRSGGGDRAASQRGKQSMPQGAKSKGGGGKGGKQKQGR